MCGCLPCAPYWALGPQPRHVPQLGIQLANLWFAGRHNPLTHTSQGQRVVISEWGSDTAKIVGDWEEFPGVKALSALLHPPLFKGEKIKRFSLKSQVQA